MERKGKKGNGTSDAWGATTNFGGRGSRCHCEVMMMDGAATVTMVDGDLGCQIRFTILSTLVLIIFPLFLPSFLGMGFEGRLWVRKVWMQLGFRILGV